jgi:cobalt/nickel transport system permease protein
MMRSEQVTMNGFWIAILVLGFFLWPVPVQAMHLSEGILPIDWAGLWLLVAAGFVCWGLRTVKRRRAEDSRWLTMVALVGAAIFVISCMPVPIPWIGTCSHPCGTGLGALLIGPGPTVVVASIALLLQALFLAHGGLTTLGANIVSMGVVGAFSAYGTYRALRALRVPLFAAAVAAGVVSDWATYATTSLQLATALHGDGSLWAMFAAVMAAFVPTQLPLGIAEGIMTAVAYRFVLQRRPELLRAPQQTMPSANRCMAPLPDLHDAEPAAAFSAAGKSDLASVIGDGR